MSAIDEKGQQEESPIAARANAQPRRRGPMGRGPRMMPGEKAGDFKGSMLKLLGFMGKFKFALVAVFVFSIASTVFNIVGPKVLSTATTELFEGVTAKIAGTGGIRFDVVGGILLYKNWESVTKLAMKVLRQGQKPAPPCARLSKAG